MIVTLGISVKLASPSFLKIKVYEIKAMKSQFLPITSLAKFYHVIQIIL